MPAGSDDAVDRIARRALPAGVSGAADDADTRVLISPGRYGHGHASQKGASGLFRPRRGRPAVVLFGPIPAGLDPTDTRPSTGARAAPPGAHRVPSATWRGMVPADEAAPATLRWAAVEAAQRAWRPTNPWHRLYSAALGDADHDHRPAGTRRAQRRRRIAVTAARCGLAPPRRLRSAACARRRGIWRAVLPSSSFCTWRARLPACPSWPPWSALAASARARAR